MKIVDMALGPDWVPTELSFMEFGPDDLLHVRVGLKDIGDGLPPWIPCAGDLQDVRDQLTLALPAAHRALVTHMGIQLHPVSTEGPIELTGHLEMGDGMPDWELEGETLDEERAALQEVLEQQPIATLEGLKVYLDGRIAQFRVIRDRAIDLKAAKAATFYIDAFESVRRAIDA